MMGRFDPFVRSEEDEEIRHHIAESVDALVAEGWEPKAARAEAERRFGRVARVRSELSGIAFLSRAATSIGLFANDVRYAVRGLWLNRTFTFAVVATLALGIGAASAIFAVVDAALWRPLPFREMERWSQFWTVYEDNNRQLGLTRAQIERWREAADGVFDAWIIAAPQQVAIVEGARADARTGVAVTPGAERLLGIPMLMGRGFTADDARPGSPTVAILQRSYWEEMGSDPAVIGSTFRTAGATTVTVVGVLSMDARVPVAYPGDLWIALRDDFTAASQEIRASQWIWARTPTGVTREVAQGRVDALAPSVAGPDARSWSIALDQLGSERQVGDDDMGGVLRILAATMGAIYLIALLNGVNLVLVRSSTRTRELAMRASLGASRLRIVRQLLAEGLVLGAIGGTVALLLASILVAAIREAAPLDLEAYARFPLAIEERTGGFVVAASLVAAALLGTIPAIGLGRGALGGSARPTTVTDSARSRRTRDGLVGVQVALSSVLLVGAVLFATSFARLVRVDPGFEQERLTKAVVAPSPVRYPDAAARSDLARRLEERLESAPEISSVTMTSGGGFSFDLALETEGSPPRSDQPTMMPFTTIGPDFFETTGTRLLAGRRLADSDVGTDNVIVDRDLARFLWSGDDPIGRRFRVSAEDPWLTVVGLVEDVKLMGRDDRQGTGVLLRPRDPAAVGSWIEIFMRTEGRPELLIPLFEQILNAMDPEQTYIQVRTASDDLAFFEEKPRFLAGLMAALAGVAVLLTGVGLYGVLAYAVSKRSRELGIRVALGAHPGRLRRSVLAEGLLVAGAGALVGLGAARAISTSIERSLYAVDPRDPALFAATAALLLTVAAVASFLPAQRATRVDPIQVLRAD